MKCFSLHSDDLRLRPYKMAMGDKPPVYERLTETRFAVTLSISLGDFIEVLGSNRQASLVRKLGSRHRNGTHARTPESADHGAAVASSIHFAGELTKPGPVAIPPIPQAGRGRPAALTNARARKVIAMACTGASIPVCAAAGEVTPNTLKSWLRRKDHEAFTLFQHYYAEAVTYATLAALKAIIEGVASHPEHVFESLARRYLDHRDGRRSAAHEDT